jgi:hypothetical protein
MTAAPAAGTGVMHVAMLRLPRVLWGELPVVLSGGVGIAAAAFVAALGFGPTSPWAPAVFALLAAAPALAVVRSVGRRLSGESRQRAFLPTLGRTVGVIAAPAAMATASLLAATAAGETGFPGFQIAAAAGALVTALLGLASVVAVPLAAARAGSLRAVWLVSSYAVVRTPIPPLAVLAAGAALAWAGIHGLAALTALAAGAIVAIGVMAGWVCLERAGVRGPWQATDRIAESEG